MRGGPQFRVTLGQTNRPPIQKDVSRPAKSWINDDIIRQFKSTEIEIRTKNMTPPVFPKEGHSSPLFAQSFFLNQFHSIFTKVIYFIMGKDENRSDPVLGHIMRLINASATFLEKKPVLHIWSIAILLDILVGMADYFTGYEIGLSVFYLAPIALCVWFIDRRAGVLMSTLGTITMGLTMYMTGYIAGVGHRDYLADLWTLFLRMSFYLIVVFLLFSLKQSFEEQRRLVRELKTALNEIKTLTGFLPICASCKKIRDDNGYWNQLEQYISEHSDAIFSHGLCPECAEKLYPEYFKKEEGRT